MIYAIIVAIIIFVLSALIMTQKYKKLNKSQYDFCTGTIKGLVKFSFIALCISFATLIIDLILSICGKNFDVLIIVYLISTLTEITFFLLIYGLLFTFEAIKDNQIIIKRLRYKVYQIEDIRNINHEQIRICFYNKNYVRLFYIDAITSGLDTFLNLIIERNPNAILTNDVLNIYGSMNNDSDKQIVLRKFGREIRDKLTKRIKSIKIIFVCSLVLLAIIALVLAILFKDELKLIIFLSVMCLIIVFIFYDTFNRQYKKDQKLDDIELGMKYRFNNKKVVGYAEYHLRNARTNSIVIMISTALLSGLMFMIDFSQKIELKENLIEIRGNFEYYYYRKSGRNSYDSIGISGSDIEYRVAFGSINKDLLKNIHVGDEITLLIDTSTPSSLSNDYTNKNKWAYFYELSYDNEYYYSYEDYKKGITTNKKIGEIFAYSLLGMSAITGVVWLVYSKKLRNGQKEEIIEI